MSRIQFTGGGGVCLSACWDATPRYRPSRYQTPRADLPGGSRPPGEQTPQEQTPPGADTPQEQTPAYSQWAAGTHPTGMHSYYCRQTKFREGNIFAPVCHSVHGGSTWHPPPRTRYTLLGPGTPPGDKVHPLGPGTPPGTRQTTLPGTRYTPRTRYDPQGLGTPPGTRYTPGDQEHPRDQVHTPPGTRYTPPLGPGTTPGLGTPPRTRYHAQDQVHPPRTRYTPPRARYTPQCRACWEIRSTRGRYASYWNAILFILCVCVGGTPYQHSWNTWVGTLKEFWTQMYPIGAFATESQIISHILRMWRLNSLRKAQCTCVLDGVQSDNT